MKYFNENQISHNTVSVSTDLKDEFIRAESVELTDTCTMKFIAGTNGFKGGDAGHGSRSYIAIKDTGGSDIEIVDQTKIMPSSNGCVQISVSGDAELRLLIDGLRWMADTLEDQVNIEKIKKVQRSVGII